MIIDEGINSEWKTLSGRLASILRSAQHPCGKIFLEFTLSIRQKCNEIFRFYEHLLDTSSMADLEGYMVVSHRNFDFAQQLHEVNAKIKDHLDNAPILLMEQFHKKNQMFWQKLRLAYEKFFFNDVGDYVIRVYRIVHGNVVLDLEKRVTQLRDLPVCTLGLEMKNEWWLSLFEPKKFFTSPSSEKEPNCSADCSTQRQGPCGMEEGSTGDQKRHSFDGDLSQIEDEDSAKCYRNVDLIREKLQIGAAKVLSRSWSDLSSGTEQNIVRFSSKIMSDEISSKVTNKLHLLSHKKVFGSFRKETRSYTHCNEQSPKLSHQHRNRSVSTPNFLSSEFRKSKSRITQASTDGSETSHLNRRDSFNHHFGPVIDSIRRVFQSPSPLSKGQCLTGSLSHMVQKVAELRSLKHAESHEPSNEMAYAVSAEDLLPLLVLMLLKLKSDEVAKLFVELCFISDMMVDFLVSGCHSYALTVFQTAFRILSQVFDDLSFP